jgi:OmcA/MtrC family decaheme c-type cytochrome
VEGYKTTIVLEGTQRQRSIRDLIPNQVVAVATDGGAASPRRVVVSSKKCNSCHYSLSFHGGNRNTAEMCTFCHNPNLTEGTPAVSWNYPNMIHRYHRAEETRYPGNLANCSQCHEGNSHQLPLDAGLLWTKNGEAPYTPVPPVTNACTSCHTSESAWSHAATNTTKVGESCAVCHAEGKSAAVGKVHAQ